MELTPLQSRNPSPAPGEMVPASSSYTSSSSSSSTRRHTLTSHSLTLSPERIRRPRSSTSESPPVPPHHRAHNVQLAAQTSPLDTILPSPTGPLDDGHEGEESDAEDLSPSHIVAQLDGRNPPHLASFAAAVTATRIRSGSLSGNSVTQFPDESLRRPSLQRQPSAPELDRWGEEGLAPTAEHEGRPTMTRDPSTRSHPHVTFADSGVAASSSSAFQPVHSNLQHPHPRLPAQGFGARGYSMPVAPSMPLDDSNLPAGIVDNNVWSSQTDNTNSTDSQGAALLSSQYRDSSSSSSSPPGLRTSKVLNSDSPPVVDPDLEQTLSAERSAELARISKGLGRRQLKAVLKKNWYLKIRNPGQFACELISPIMMVMVIVIGWIFSLDHISEFPDERFANATGVVGEVFEWVMGHIEPIPGGGNVPNENIQVELDFQRSLTNRFTHRREDAKGFVYGRSRDEALKAGLTDEIDEEYLINKDGRTILDEDGFATPFEADFAQDVEDAASRPSHDWSLFSRLNRHDRMMAYDTRKSNHSIQVTPKLSRGGLGSIASSISSLPSSHPYRRLLEEIDDDEPIIPPTNVTCFPLESLPGKQFCYDKDEGHLLEDILDYNGPMHIPRFDEFVTAHLAMKYLLNNTVKTFENLNENIDRIDHLTNGRLSNLIFLGKLFFCPDRPEVHDLVRRLNQTYQLFDLAFTGVVADEETALDLSQENLNDDKDRTWAIMVFNELDLENGLLDYTIRMNSSVLPTTQSTQVQFAQGINDDYKEYYYSGFLTLQIMMEELALNVSSGQGWSNPPLYPSSLPFPLNPAPSLEQTIMGIPFPVLHYSGNSFYTTIGPLVGLVFCMSMLYPVSRLIKGVVEEKETKTKETMKIMGLKDWVFNASWFITFFLQFLVTALMLVILLHFTVLPKTNPTLLFAFFMCFFMSEISLGFLITVFFSKAKLAGILGPIILFAATMPRYAFFSKDAAAQNSTESLVGKTLVSIFSPTAFTLGVDLMVQYEHANQSMGWSNLNDDAFSMGRVMGFLLIDFVLYAVLAGYLDRVLPNEYGQRLPPFFCCKRSYWKDHVQLDYDENDEQGNDDESMNVDAVVEPVPASMHSQARVHVKKLRKQFTEGRGKDARTMVAVNGLNLTLYEGQITTLLGHNGAGKSTTISMLTGMIAPTSGDCSIHGYSILKNMKEIRKSVSIGVCPQTNCLFSKLTVKEHLELFATLKGVKPEELENEVETKIKEVGLEDKRDVYSSALSGGQQRRVQLSMAFIGGSKVVFLDEPTSGMDPYSRRGTWELIRNAKKDRVIVLTTHFMDEADLLGDRIAIMSEGKLRCCGSSLFLKSHYGIGYNLTLVKASKKCRTEQVSKMVMFFCPEAKVLSTAGGEMSYRLPWTSVSHFPGLFAQLEERSHQMGIGAFGIGTTTLEEVFMRCAQIGDPATQKCLTEDGEGGETGGGGVEKRKRTLSNASLHRTGSRSNSRKSSNAGGGSPPRHRLLPPVAQTTSSSAASGDHGSSYVALSDDANNDKPSSSSSSLTNVPESTECIIPPRHHATLWDQFTASIYKRYTCALRDLKGRFFEVVLPVIVLALVLLILKLNGLGEAANIPMKAELYSGPGIYTPLWYTRGSPDEIEPGTLYALEHARNIPPGPDAFFTILPKLDLTDSVQVTDRLLETYDTHLGSRYGAIIFNDSVYTHFNSTDYSPEHIYVEHPPLTIMHNTTFFHSLPILVAEIAQARWNMNRWRTELNAGVTVNNLSQVRYHLYNHPLPMTAVDSLRTKTYLTLFAALFILIPFCYLPASFVLFVVKERTVKSKHLQFVSGLNPNIYWLSTWAWDVTNFIAIAISVMLVMIAYQHPQFAGSFEAISATFLLFFQYGLAAIPLSYCYSFCFGNYTSAQVGIAGLNFLTGFVLIIASYMLDNIHSTAQSNIVLKNFYRIFPSYVLGEGLVNLATRDFYSLVHGTPKPSPYNWDILGRDLTYLFFEGIIYLTITLLLESNFVHRMVRYLFNLSGEFADPGPERVADEDCDVAAERERVQKLRVRILKPTENGYAFHGLSSPVTPGYGLKSPGTAKANGSNNASGDGANGNFDWSINMTHIDQTKQPLPADANTLTSPLLINADRDPDWPVVHSQASPGQSEEKVASDMDYKSASRKSTFFAPQSLAIDPPPPMERGESAETVGELPTFPYHMPQEDIKDSAEDDEDILVLQHLRKVYPARGGGKVTVAVDNLSLGIRRNSVFGFLGINGAGKTTTMKMLTGDIPISKGRAYINGFSVVKQLAQVRKEVGYCPQFDPLLDLMTARETLTMYARIHGLPKKDIPEIVQRLLTTLGLGKFADKQCGPFSGGGKRKLSLAMALIGDPSVVFLDEPSTGMDPVSRRFMWSVIESISDGRSVILTTHSMEECEALCNRIGIMVSGRMQCLGSVQHLKSRYGQGYMMEINGAESSVKKIQAFIARVYPSAVLDELHAGRMKYRLPQQGVTLSGVFSTMEANKAKLNIVDYSISQCSLESIFIGRVKEQKDHETTKPITPRP